MSRNKAFSAYITKVDGELKRSLLDGLEFIQWKKYVKKDSTVFIKPNFTFPSYYKGITTNPELLRCLLDILRERSNSVILGESNGGNHYYKAEDAFKAHKMDQICKEAGVELVNLSNLPSTHVEAEVRGKRVRVQLPKMLLESVDCFISVPVLKVHVMTGVSLGLKNLWGCYPDTMRCLYHQDFDRKLALMAKLLDPRITVIDGLYALDGHGPLFGDLVRMDLALVSDNVVVADTLGASIIGIPLKGVKHIKVAEREGIGTMNLERVKLNTDWKQYRRVFKARKTSLDIAAILSFNSHIVAKLIMDSPFTPLAYMLIDKLRSPDEKKVASQLNRHKYYECI